MPTTTVPAMTRGSTSAHLHLGLGWTLGPESWKLECGGEETGQAVEDRQVHSQGLGIGPEEGARKGLLLSGSWQPRTLRAVNQSANLCNWPGIHRNVRPLTGGCRCARGCRLLPNKKAGE